jgi:hypothetical protein
MASIEEEAAKCGNKKGQGGSTAGSGFETGSADAVFDAEGGDPKFREAVEVAIDCGKISTSLLQRRLEVGYGRAAKPIDRMEELGYVSAPDGNKPRKILITKQDFMERELNGGVAAPVGAPADGNAAAPAAPVAQDVPFSDAPDAPIEELSDEEASVLDSIFEEDCVPEEEPVSEDRLDAPF